MSAMRKVKYGQAAEPIDIDFEEMIKGEQRLIQLLNGSGSGAREPMLIVSCAKQLKVANHQVRNYLRRLVRGGWAERTEPLKDEVAKELRKGKGRGRAPSARYRITEKGRKRLNRSNEEAKVEE